MRVIKSTRIILGIMVVVCMGIIFLNSAQPAKTSNKISKSISKEINDNVIKKIPGMGATNLSKLNNFIRKFAHFFQFLVLAIFLNLFMISIGMRTRNIILLSLLIVAIYAGLDEFHQLFVEGRGAQLRDVLIDTWGGITGIAISQIMYNTIKLIKKRIVKSSQIKTIQN